MKLYRIKINIETTKNSETFFKQKNICFLRLSEYCISCRIYGFEKSVTVTYLLT